MNEDFDNWVLLPVHRDVAARSGSWAGWHGVRGDYMYPGCCGLGSARRMAAAAMTRVH